MHLTSGVCRHEDIASAKREILILRASEHLSQIRTIHLDAQVTSTSMVVGGVGGRLTGGIGQDTGSKLTTRVPYHMVRLKGAMKM